MKKTSASFKAVFVKHLVTLAVIIAGSTGFTRCYSQSIVGKWKGVSVQNTFSPEFAKRTGKSMEEKTSKEAGNSDIEYKSDHTFSMSFSAPNSSDVTTMRGTWSLAGDQLKLTLEPQYNPQHMTTSATISISGNTLTTTAVMAPPARIIKTISVGTRM